MIYSWGSITESCINFGNFLIEKTLQDILYQHGFDKPNFIFDTIKQEDNIIKKINQTDFVIIPGCTTLTLDDYPGLKNILSNIKVPIYNIGAAFSGKTTNPGVKNLNSFYQPISTRDPFSDYYLKKHNFKTSLVGCPTLHSGMAEKFEYRNNKKIIFFFGYKEIEIQQKILKYVISLGYNAQVIIQENKQMDIFKGLPVELINYDVDKVLDKIKNARLIVTARLHGALPAIALGTPLFFVKTMENQRFSLLQYLGITLNQANDRDLEKNLAVVSQKPLTSNSPSIYRKVKILRKNFLNYLNLIEKEIND